MFGSIYIGLTGLNAYSKGLQTVSNNVSNMNTIGYKASDISFSDLFGYGSRGGLDYATSQDSGGHGVSVSQRSINFKQGEIRQTDRDLDLAVDGNGFLVLLDGDNTYYTRTGSFEINDEGFIVLQGTDYRLATLDPASGKPTAINIDASRTDPPVATDRIKFADNLSSTATSYTIPDVKVFDARGKENVWTLSFTRTETAFDTWQLRVTDSTGKVIGTKELKFSGGAVSADTKELVFEDADAGLSVTFDFSNSVTSFSSGTVSSLRAADVAGHGTGSIATVKINDKGEIELTYTNEEKKQLGALALADFRDPQALEQRSRALFVYTGFGQRQYLVADDTRVGTIKGGRLEASNVDLGAQFGELILIQRGFQASSQIISVTNDMIQQLFGIRGQG
jgi:flagellar hook protein FlgE